MDWQACREEMMENICFDHLVEEYNKEDVEWVTDLITVILISTQTTVKIGREKVSIQMVRSRFRKLDETQIEHVFDCLHKSTKNPQYPCLPAHQSLQRTCYYRALLSGRGAM